MDHITIPNACRPEPGVLTGGQPALEQAPALAAAGVRTVVNLRAEEPALRAAEQAAFEAAGVRYVAIPVPGLAGVTHENAAQLAAVLADVSARPLIVHCKSGNRVGALVALSAAAGGADLEAAVRQGRAYGLTSLEPAVRDILG